MFSPDPVVSSYDRLGISISAALLLHAVIILALGFSPFAKDNRRGATKLEITLAQFQSDEKVEDADFRAQHNQQASGTEAEKSEITTDELATYNDVIIKDVSKPELVAAPPPNPLSQAPQLTTTSDSQFTVPAELEQLQDPMPATLEAQFVLPHQNEIASLQAKFDEQRRSLAKRPRIARVISVASQKSMDAAYEHDWDRRIETIGNAHYPEQSRRRKIYGSLRLVVQINTDGSLRNIGVLESSGHVVLDTAAIDIVRMAAPFAPLPIELQREYDAKEIVRTFFFERNRLSSKQ